MEYISLRFFGNGVSPSTTRCKELASVISAAEDLVEALNEQSIDRTGEDLESVPLCVSELKDSSLGLKFTSLSIAVVLASWHDLAAIINSGNFEGLNPKSRNSFAEILSFVKKKQCTVSIGDSSNEVLSSFDSSLVLPKQIKIKGQTSILGEVLRVGGTEPKVRIKMTTGKTLSCEASEGIACDLGHRLYDRVSCRGFAVWDFDTGELLSFKIQEISKFRKGLPSKAFDEFYQKLPQTMERWQRVGVKGVLKEMCA